MELVAQERGEILVIRAMHDRIDAAGAIQFKDQMRDLTRDSAAGSESGEVDELSFGAREQMGVIARLAYADLLKAAGKPTLIILDDALVHSDDARLERMKRVLFDAARRHQVLLFTCHPDKWRDMGVPVRTLETAL